MASTTEHRANTSAERKVQYTRWVCILLAAVSFVVYSRALYNGFVNYDDLVYISENPQVKAGLTGATVRWAFTTFWGGNWFPLTWISHALDVQMFGLSPAGHHLTNIVFHSLNAVVLFLLLYKTTRTLGRSLTVAMLFALHPLNVESVAWVAERKSVLSTFLFFLALAAYGWYVKRPSIQRYGLVALSFALGLMAKPMVITLPFVLLLLDFWPLRRVNLHAVQESDGVPQRSFLSLLKEKVPLFALVVASAVMTLMAQRSAKAIMPLGSVPLGWRLANAIRAYSLYIIKAIYPAGLAVFYPITAVPLWQFLASLLFLTAVSIWVWREGKQYPYLIVGWLWYLGTMVPVIGLVQVGAQSMADRYAYIPLIGIFVMVVWRLADAADSFALTEQWRVFVVCAVLLVYAALTRHQLGFWQNEFALWSHAAEVTPANRVAEDNLGLALADMRQYDEAISHFNNAIRMSPDLVTPYIALAFILRDRDPQQAIKDGLTALSLTDDPGQLAAIYGDLGVAFNNIGDYPRASQSFQQVLKQDSANATAIMGLGHALLEQQAQRIERNLKEHPTAEGYSGLGNVYEQAADVQHARQAYQEAVNLDQRLASAQQGLQRLGKPAQ